MNQPRRHCLAATMVFMMALAFGLPAEAGPFDQGRVRIALGGSSASAFGDGYFVIGYGAGFYVLDGLEVGIDVDHWLGGTPSIHKLSEQVRYVLHMVPTLHPFLGVFHKHWFVGDGLDDIDTIGGRLGAFFSASEHFFMGGGVVHEIVLSECDTDCSSTYPEIIFSATF